MRIGLVGVALAGCAYTAGSFADYRGDFAGERVALPCLDLAVVVRRDALEGPVVAYDVGNRCEHAVTVDLVSVRVIARDGDGHEVPLAPYDPRHELAVLPLAASWMAHEAIEYRGMPVADVAELCVD